jgi:hypothetical protein
LQIASTFVGLVIDQAGKAALAAGNRRLGIVGTAKRNCGKRIFGRLDSKQESYAHLVVAPKIH